MLIDSHCHLNFPEFREDIDAVVENARRAGVKGMVSICTDLEEFDEIHEIANRYENVWCSVGVHPNDAGVKNEADAKTLVELSKHPKVVAFGETGLDYYRDTADKKDQEKSFLAHIEAARETGLPIIVHTRNADEATAELLRKEIAKGEFTGVMHCFASSRELAEKSLELGFYISFSGIVTFKNAKDLQEIAKIVPLERMLVETDAPFLAPMPHRGKRCEPAYTRLTAEFIAELKGVPYEELAAKTTANFFQLFSKAAL